MRARTPLGYRLRRDPHRYRFEMPNHVWEYKLKAPRFVILAYLCSRRGERVSKETVAACVHMSAATVEKHLATLVSEGLVCEDGTLTLRCDAGNFFTLPNEVFLLNLSPSTFMVYAYLLFCEDRRTHQCYPSIRTIARVTGLAVGTVMKAIDTLADADLITVQPSHWFNEQGLKQKGNNIYTIRPTRGAMEILYQRQLARKGRSA